jgi:hypothetical protein
MADVKISSLPASTVPLAGTEVLPIVQGSQTRQVSINNLTTGKAVSATQYTSTIVTGTAPLVVASTTEVANLRAANATSADTANQVKSNATTGVLQVAGPATASTRVMTTPDANFTVARTDAAQTFTGDQTIADDVATPVIQIIRNANAGTSAGTKVSFQFNTTETGYLYNRFNGADFETQLQATQQIIFKTGSSGGTERMRIASGGNLLVGVTSGSDNTIQHPTQTQGNTNLALTNCANFFVSSGGGGNAAATSMRIGNNTTTSRSINAGGTINASGTDYAEYMTKAGNFTLAKGDICGINANGQLTNVFADAVSFVVKSTNPSYVGGDSWGTEKALGLELPKQPLRVKDDTDETFADKETQYITDKTTFDEALEAARQLVDRIAFSGQVPVNVLNAIPGQYIIPVNDNNTIKGQAVNSPTFEQYQLSVGKVICIEPDGRAKIIVKTI